MCGCIGAPCHTLMVSCHSYQPSVLIKTVDVKNKSRLNDVNVKEQHLSLSGRISECFISHSSPFQSHVPGDNYPRGSCIQHSLHALRNRDITCELATDLGAKEELKKKNTEWFLLNGGICKYITSRSVLVRI